MIALLINTAKLIGNSYGRTEEGMLFHYFDADPDDPIREWYMDGGLNRNVFDKAENLTDLYKKFREDVEETEDLRFMPGKRRFFQQVRALVSRDPEWNITRLTGGFHIHRALLM